jgi:hypothetical protein
MARKPKPNSPGRNDDSAAHTARRSASPAWQQENQSTQNEAPTRWFSAHEYTTSEDTLRTPKAEDKPGIGAPSARQERDAVPNEGDTEPRERGARAPSDSSHERPSRTRRSPSARSRRDAAPRSRRPGQAH